MEKVPFIYQWLLFGTGAIKAQPCYLSLQKGFVRHRAKGKRGKEKAKEGGRPLEIGRNRRSNCLSFNSHVSPSPSCMCCCPHLVYLLWWDTQQQQKGKLLDVELHKNSLKIQTSSLWYAAQVRLVWLKICIPYFFVLSVFCPVLSDSAFPLSFSFCLIPQLWCLTCISSIHSPLYIFKSRELKC